MMAEVLEGYKAWISQSERARSLELDFGVPWWILGCVPSALAISSPGCLFFVGLRALLGVVITLAGALLWASSAGEGEDA